MNLRCLIFSCFLLHTAVGQEKSVPTAPPADKQEATIQSAQTAASVKTDAEVDGLLFFATDDTSTPTVSPDAALDEKELGPTFMEDLRTRLGKTHPYKTYQLLGRHTQKVFKEYESWVVPSKELCLKMDSRGPTENGGVQLHIQLWQDKKVLVKSDAKLAPDQPIIIGGPKWRKGRLIFVLNQRKAP
jgi:hypothetical protein